MFWYPPHHQGGVVGRPVVVVLVVGTKVLSQDGVLCCLVVKGMAVAEAVVEDPDPHGDCRLRLAWTGPLKDVVPSL